MTFLSLRTGIAIQTHPSMADQVRPSRYATVPHLPCPSELLVHFQKPVELAKEIRRTFQLDKSRIATIIGKTWHASDACLGSVNRSSFWTQRKPLIAYWQTVDDPAVVFRAQFLHDGKDFASMGLLTAQNGPRVLCLFESIPNRGDWHRSLDRPADGVFQATDFRVRFELLGAGISAKSLSDGRYELAAGTRRIVIHTLPGHFVGRDIEWIIGKDGRSLEGICYSGARRKFDFKSKLNVTICAVIELLRNHAVVSDRRPQLANLSGRVEARWAVADGDVMEVNSSED